MIKLKQLLCIIFLTALLPHRFLLAEIENKNLIHAHFPFNKQEAAGLGAIGILTAFLCFLWDYTQQTAKERVKQKESRQKESLFAHVKLNRTVGGQYIFIDDIFKDDCFKKPANYASLNKEIYNRNRIRNSLFWAAFGDGFGNEVEFTHDINQIMRKSGYDQDPLNDNYQSLINKNNFINYTDDTRMSLLVIKALLDNNKDTKNIHIEIASNFKKDMKNLEGWNAYHRAPGKSTIEVITTLPESSKITVENVFLSSEKFDNAKGGGCGSVMHAYPFGYIFDENQAIELSMQHSRITHNHPIAVASCGTLSWIISKLIHQNASKEDILNHLPNLVDDLEKECVEKHYSSIKNTYNYRMKKIIISAIAAANEMKEIREKIWNGDLIAPYQIPFKLLLAKHESQEGHTVSQEEIKKYINLNYYPSKYDSCYLIPFHELMKNETFKTKHIQFFPSAFSKNYTYDTKEFPGWDAATCLAAAIYNFSLWIPEDHNKIFDQKHTERFLANALMSSIITGGDSDSIAGITGALCGASFSSDSVPENLKKVIEGSRLIENYAQKLSEKSKHINN